ncbi:MAG: hypothetical protein PHE32_04005 [Candidatus Shapirobacteria bacterium]|nr:hypothetical protein [Candidatus Shapirobacteria bacterium]
MPKSVDRRIKKNEGKLSRVFTVKVVAELGSHQQRQLFDTVMVNTLKILQERFKNSHRKNRVKFIIE